MKRIKTSRGFKEGDKVLIIEGRYKGEIGVVFELWSDRFVTELHLRISSIKRLERVRNNEVQLIKN